MQILIDLGLGFFFSCKLVRENSLYCVYIGKIKRGEHQSWMSQ